MKTKNVRVRTSDIKYGRIIYKSSPFYGIDKYKVLSRPYFVKGIGLFFDVLDGSGYKDKISICDAGINAGDSYNNKKTFFKLKHADEWAKKMKNDVQVLIKHKRHLECISSSRSMYW